jgi:hypothetical protein
MIVGMALLKVFENLTLNVNNQDISVQFHFGDQKEYNQWIASKMRSNRQKYPLIWYVISPHERQKNETIDVDSQLILFMGTKQEYNNIQRYQHNYLTYLEPLLKLVNKTLERHSSIQLYENPINDFDEPNFGKNNDNDFETTSSRKKDPKSIGIDIVDAKILKLKMNINVNCILT